MEKLNRFEEEIRLKMAGHEEEAGAESWFRLKAELEPKKEKQPLGFRIAVAATIALLVTMAFLLNRPAKDENLIAEEIKNEKQDVLVPDVKNNQEKSETKTFAKDLPSNLFANPYSTVNNQNENNLAEEILNDNKDQQENEIILPEKFRDLPYLPVPEKKYADHTPEILNKNQPEHKDRKKFSLADLSSENLKSKRPEIIEKITDGASGLLGIDADYDRKEMDNAVTTSFHANLGLFKVRKVRTTSLALND